ncbi:MAG: hypothetical protein LBK53_06535 [Heliobacteriaceae bacterium]|jgi:hypothetical protein|nr:hypothetical protein [Heliobacteriaceae bacterium]
MSGIRINKPDSNPISSDACGANTLKPPQEISIFNKLPDATTEQADTPPPKKSSNHDDRRYIDRLPNRNNEKEPPIVSYCKNFLGIYFTGEDAADKAKEYLKSLSDNTKPRTTQSISSEGLERKINTITVTSNVEETAPGTIEELKRIGEEVGFTVQTADTYDIWLEDPYIRRHDGKVLVSDLTKNNKYAFRSQANAVSELRGNISTGVQGRVSEGSNYKEYIKLIPDEDRVVGKSYLEGGNVLNHRSSDESPAAIIGEESIGYTLAIMELEDTPENREIAQAQIAEDLGLPKENVTFIRQFDFHIDMWYRPLQNGVVAAPDFDSAIDMVAEILQDPELEDSKKEDLEKLNEGLQEMKILASQHANEAEDKLKQAGYKIIKAPSFAVTPNIPDVMHINYMNGVGGTADNGETYYITNTSGIPQLDDKIEQYLKDNANIDKTYFTPTNTLLKKMGGLDCITQEN